MRGCQWALEDNQRAPEYPSKVGLSHSKRLLLPQPPTWAFHPGLEDLLTGFTFTWIAVGSVAQASPPSQHKLLSPTPSAWGPHSTGLPASFAEPNSIPRSQLPAGRKSGYCSAVAATPSLRSISATHSLMIFVTSVAKPCRADRPIAAVCDSNDLKRIVVRESTERRCILGAPGSYPGAIAAAAP